MSDAHSTTEHDGSHDTPIKTPKQLIATVIAAFVVPILIIVLLVTFVTSNFLPSAGSTGEDAEAVARRIQPVGRVELRDASNVAALKNGEQVYTAVCAACHASGAAGAPKLGDADAWGPRLKTGFEALLNSALKGKGAMGAQGGGDHSDLEIARAVVYLANKAGANFPEPKAPGGAAAAPAAAAAPSAAAPAADADQASVKVEGGVVKFYFASGKADLANDAAAALAQVISGVSGGKKAVISGYHDATGDPAKNAELAKQRAFAARDALVAAGVSADRIELKKPEQINAGTAAEARRVEVTLQ